MTFDRDTFETRRREREHLKAAYGSAYEDLLTLFGQYDVFGLISMGAPEDEYEPEVGTILPRLLRATEAGTFCESEVQRIIYEEFAAWFSLGMARRVARWGEMAREIISAWPEGIT